MRRLAASLAVVCVSAAVVVIARFLFAEGLDRAEKWLSISVGLASLTVAALGLRLARGGAGRQSGDPAEKRRAVRSRQMFADHIESQIRRLNEKEDWRDSRFAELEALVEIEGGQRRRWGLRVRDDDPGRRRVRSLTDGVRRSTERLVLVEGEPGSGKSVALRHLAYTLAARAVRSRSADSLIPIFINLRGFRPPGGTVSRQDLREYVLAELNRANSSDVADFLDAEFDNGLRKGTWIFLFDSFDEIPDILSATDSSAVVEAYADAIFDFLHYMNRSRGIVASREFKGPRTFGWPRFTVLRLSPRQQLDLIEKANLTAVQREELVSGLARSGEAVTEFAGNPMMLSLLCAYLRNNGTFPLRTHDLFDDYVDARLERDADRLTLRFGLTRPQVRSVAEQVAFCMAGDPGLSLAPTRAALRRSVSTTFGAGPDIGPALSALEFVKIASRPDHDDADPPFTFAHRRLQEFFATCVVLREPERVPIPTLLLDGRWRETAVTLLQAEADSPYSDELLAGAERLAGTLPADRSPGPAGYPWPRHALHICDLVRDGVSDDSGRLPESFRHDVGALLTDAYRRGWRLDKKWATDVAVLAPPPVRDEILNNAAIATSPMLQQTAFAQAGRLSTLPDSLRRHIRKLLVGMLATGRLRRERLLIQAQLHRLANSRDLLRGVNLLLAVPVVDAVLAMLCLAGFVAFLRDALTAGGDELPPGLSGGPGTGLIAVLHLFSITFFLASGFLFRFLPVVSFVPSGSGFRATLARLAPAHRPDREGDDATATFLGISRFVVALIVGATLLRLHDPLLLVLWIHLAMWSIAAIGHVANGGDARFRRWPLLPLTEIVRMMRSRVPRPSRRMVGVLLLAPPLLTGLGLAADHFPTVPHLGSVIAVFVAATYGACAVGILVIGPAWIYRRVQRLTDAWRRRRNDRRLLDALEEIDGSLDEDRLAGLLEQFRTDVGTRRLIHRIRRGEVAVTAGAQRLLATIAVAAEARLGGEPIEDAVDTYAVGERTLDEIAMLLDERRASDSRDDRERLGHPGEVS